MRIVFLGGVHGVGKTTIGRTLACQANGDVFTASDLIRREKADSEFPSDKRVGDLDGNQALLVAAFAKAKTRSTKQVLILDGHFVLTEQSGRIAAIPTNVFQRLGVTELMCVTDRVDEIEKRLRHRDGEIPSGIDINAMQAAEVERAKAVSGELSLALRFVTPDSFSISGRET